jgi:hypothetical protein
VYAVVAWLLIQVTNNIVPALQMPAWTSTFIVVFLLIGFPIALMSMEDWAKRLDAFLQFDERDILQDNGSISATLAKEFAESEFEKYRVIQDRLFESDFDNLVDRCYYWP